MTALLPVTRAAPISPRLGGSFFFSKNLTSKLNDAPIVAWPIRREVRMGPFGDLSSMIGERSLNGPM